MLAEVYNPTVLEKEIQANWQEENKAKVTENLDKPSYYCLSMLPYPSGELHMGHVRNYTLSDVITRRKLMQGFQVLHPFGWDSFGLPAENAAIKNNNSPYKWTINNINNMRKQLKQIGLHVDWSREVTTCGADYYKWNQWLFLQLYAKGLVYQKKSSVNWDPVDNTVLANEQVVNGCGWRSGAPIVQKTINQWFFKTTAYAKELLDDLKKLDAWPQEVKTMQENWIGLSNGAEISFAIESKPGKDLIAFTTRAETVYGVSFIAISHDHELANELYNSSKKIKNFIDECKNSSVSEVSVASIEKKGINTDLFAINPISGKKTPIWIANYVLAGVGTGCVMGVPAHDERDYAFAKKYELEIIPVISPKDAEWDFANSAYIEAKGVLVNSKSHSSMTIDQARESITNLLVSQATGGPITTYRLRDWGISRQRYWGTPIPIIYCNNCGVIPEAEENLPVKLPILETLTKSGNPLDKINEFINTVCPKCSAKARRETDTMDTFVDSSWYFLRYTCADQQHSILDDRSKFWTPVDQYIGGIEHATMHLLYARFMHKAIRDLGLINSDEPFKKLLTLGMVLKDGHKMSKSKGNVVSPKDLIERYGADTIRLYSMFTAPPEQTLEWSDAGVEGAYKFLKKLWAFSFKWQNFIKVEQNNVQSNDVEINLILKQILFDYERQQFNTVVSGAMKILNVLNNIEHKQENTQLVKSGLSILLRVLAPITPHICQYIWHNLQFGNYIFDEKAPKVNNSALNSDTVEIVVQINGKLRSKIIINKTDTEDIIIKKATSDNKVNKHLCSSEIKKTIIIPGKIINIVI
jgi:leucyl-tRNA synthetase